MFMAHLFFVCICFIIRFMVATLDYIESKFHEFNALIFDGVLKPLPFKLSSARTFLGQLRYRRRRKWLGGWIYEDFQLVISACKDFDERLLEDTLIHEMIHYYILFNQLQDTTAHGKLFRQMRDDINRRFGRNVTISHKVSDKERFEDTDRRKHLLCVSHFRDGRVGVTLAAETRVIMLWRELSKFPEVVECRWYITYNSFFNRFRRSLKPKIYLVDKAELERKIFDATPLVMEGRTIKCVSIPK